MSSEWIEYKQKVKSVKDQIDGLYKQYYALTAKCTCEEKKKRSTPSRSFTTLFDECIICLKIHNVKTVRTNFRYKDAKSNR